MKKMLQLLCLIILPFFAFGQDLEITDKTVFKNESGKVIGMDEFQSFINSGDYTIDPKLDGLGNLIEIQLLKLTEEDKIMASRVVDIKSDAINKPIQPYSVSALNGKAFASEGQKGKVTVMKFWFKECKPCIDEMPKLNKLVDLYADNAEVDFIAFGLDTPKDIGAFVKRNPFKYNLVPNAEGVRASMNISAFPTHIVVDKNGIVSEFIQGGHLYIERELEQAIEVALGNRAPEENYTPLQPAEIDADGAAIGFVIESTTTIKNEAGDEIDFDTFMELMDTGNYEPQPAKTESGRDYIIVKKKKS